MGIVSYLYILVSPHRHTLCITDPLCFESTVGLTTNGFPTQRANDVDLGYFLCCLMLSLVVSYGGVEGPPHIFFRHHAISYG